MLATFLETQFFFVLCKTTIAETLEGRNSTMLVHSIYDMLPIVFQIKNLLLEGPHTYMSTIIHTL